MTNEITIRTAIAGDAETILSLIKKLAAFEKLSDKVTATPEKIHHTLFGPRPYAECLLAEQNGAPIGFALFFHNYSTFLGQPGIWIEDVFVDEAARGQGLGLRFFKEIARIAQARNCGRIEWSVLDWNEPAIKFYEKMGATAKKEWVTYQLDQNAISAVAKG